MPYHDIQAESSASVRQSQRTITFRPDQTTDTPNSDIRTSQSSLVVNTSIADKDDTVFADRQSVPDQSKRRPRRSARILQGTRTRSHPPPRHPLSASDSTVAPARATHVEQDLFWGENACPYLLPVLPTLPLHSPLPSTVLESPIL